MNFRALKPHLAPPFAPARPPDDEQVVTLPVPGFRQVRNYSCGFAAALMVVRYFDLAVPGRELFRLLGTDRSGTRQTAIVRVLRRLGLRASVRYDADFDRIARGIDAGKVVVAYLHDVEHWLIAYGYGRAPDRIFVADPRPGHPCEEPWEAYGPRLGGFGIFCSRPSVAEAPAPLAARARRSGHDSRRDDPRDRGRPAQLAFDFR